MQIVLSLFPVRTPSISTFPLYTDKFSSLVPPINPPWENVAQCTEAGWAPSLQCTALPFGSAALHGIQLVESSIPSA